MKLLAVIGWLDRNWTVPASAAAIAAFALWGQLPASGANGGRLILFYLSNAIALAMPVAIVIGALEQRARALTRNGIKPPIWPITGLADDAARTFRFGIAGTIVGYAAFIISTIMRLLNQTRRRV